MPATSANQNAPIATPRGHYLADLYSFKWSGFNFQLPLVSASAVALCLFVGILAGHPGGGLIAAGGAFTIGFGANQRIADSRLIPMIVAVFGCSTATLAGTVAGHKDVLADYCRQRLRVYLRRVDDAQRRTVVGGATGFGRAAHRIGVPHRSEAGADPCRAHRRRGHCAVAFYFGWPAPHSTPSQGTCSPLPSRWSTRCRSRTRNS